MLDSLHPDSNSHRSDWIIANTRSGSSGGFTTLQAVLGIHLPPENELCDTEILTLLNQCEIELLSAGVQVTFLDRLPARVAYRGLVQACDTLLPEEKKPGQHSIIDGCDSACESCFQLAHCHIAQHVLGKGLKKNNANEVVNPSWAAFFSHDRRN